jgi:hypothetical protein
MKELGTERIKMCGAVEVKTPHILNYGITWM